MIDFNFYSFFLYVFISSFTPGPNNILSMSNAVRFGGLKNSYPFHLGVLAGFSVVTLLGAIFSSTLFNYIPKVKIYMLAAGAAYMLYLAWKIFKSSSEIELKGTGKASFISGALLQFINPKLFIYSITAMSVYIIPAFGSGLILFAGFSFLLAFIGFTSTLLWALFGEIFHKVLREHSRLVNSIMSLLLVYCAVSLFF